jgi:hypothetical protein
VVLDEASLFNIAVDPAWQRRGFGRQLLQHLIDEQESVRPDFWQRSVHSMERRDYDTRWRRPAPDRQGPSPSSVVVTPFHGVNRPLPEIRANAFLICGSTSTVKWADLKPALPATASARRV